MTLHNNEYWFPMSLIFILNRLYTLKLKCYFLWQNVIVSTWKPPQKGSYRFLSIFAADATQTVRRMVLSLKSLFKLFDWSLSFDCWTKSQRLMENPNFLSQYVRYLRSFSQRNNLIEESRADLRYRLHSASKVPNPYRSCLPQSAKLLRKLTSANSYKRPRLRQRKHQ